MNKIWVLNWSTESGDMGVIGYWREKPKAAALNKFLKAHFIEDYKEKTLYHTWKELEEQTG